MTNKVTHLAQLLASQWKLVLLVAGIAGGVFWFQFAAIPVATHSITEGSLIDEVMGTGTLEARVSATVSPKISGRVAELLADQGDMVQSGEVLVRLDDAELQQQVAIAEANVAAAAAGIVRLRSDKNRAEAVYQQAQKSFERVQLLIQQNAVSKDELDKAIEALAVGEAGMTRAEAAIGEGQKQLIAAEKTSQYHRARLQDTQIVAPFAGLIVRRSREPGDVAVPGSSILTLISTDEIWVNAWVDETEMARLQRGQPARVMFRSNSDQVFAGSLARLGREADRETREFIVNVHVLELPTNWAVGQRAEVFIRIAEIEQAVLLPTELMLHREGVDGVFVLAGDHAVWRPIQTGVRSRVRNMVQVTEGLTAGAIVVTPVNASTSLRSGRKVVTR